MLHIRPASSNDLDFIVSGNLALALETETLTLDAAVLRLGVNAHWAILGHVEVVVDNLQNDALAWTPNELFAE